jgi:hypothetical protein
VQALKDTFQERVRSHHCHEHDALLCFAQCTDV